MKDPARQRREGGKAMDQLVPLDQERQGEPRGDDVSDDREGQQSLVHGSKRSSVARVYHIPDADYPRLSAESGAGAGLPYPARSPTRSRWGEPQSSMSADWAFQRTRRSSSFTYMWQCLHAIRRYP